MTLYVNNHVDDEGEGETVVRMAPVTDKGFWHHLRKYLREYTEVTGIHGVRYVTEKRSRTEKIVWAFFLLLSLAGCIYMIYEILYKYENSPVVVSFASEDTPIYQIPFPAITICPESKYSTKNFNFSKTYFHVLHKEKIEKAELSTFEHVGLLCDEDDPENFDGFAKIVNNTFFETVSELQDDPAMMMLLCHFNDETMPCVNIFTPILIDEGVCYSFNILDRTEIFKHHVFHYGEYYQVENKSENNFDPQTGYKDGVGVETYPRRALMSGADNSLVIFLVYNNNNTDFVCNPFFKGFRFLLHNPWDVPRMSKHYVQVPTGRIAVAAIEPELVTTSPNVKKFSPDKRKCFMEDERPLQHFKYYTQPNCLFECVTNYTLNKCGCVEFFMPRDNKTDICGLGSLQCVEKAEVELKIKELEYQLAGKKFCDCKPSCSNLYFKTETTHTNFYSKEYFQAHQSVMPYANLISGWNISVLQLYFKNEQFMVKERNELYGVSDLISNLGGLVGLFTGFSLISGIEIIYFCTLRLFYNERIYGLWSGPP